MVRWYMTPERLQKINQDGTPLCWRNCGKKATMIHIWWDCPKIRVFWQEVIRSIKEITGEKIEDNKLTCLFHDTNSPIKQYMKNVTSKLLNAAKGLIPKNWLKSKSPDLREWFKQVDHYPKMELLSCKNKGQLDNCDSVWNGWERYKTLDSYWQKNFEDVRS